MAGQASQPIAPISQPTGDVSKHAIPTGDVSKHAIPVVGDETAPRPELGQPTLSPNAIRQRASRIFTPRANGSLKVSETIYKEWKAKGKERKTLEQIFAQCGYDPVIWVSFSVEGLEDITWAPQIVPGC